MILLTRQLLFNTMLLVICKQNEKKIQHNIFFYVFINKVIYIQNLNSSTVIILRMLT